MNQSKSPLPHTQSTWYAAYSATIHAFPKQPIASKDLWKALRGMYGTEPFIRLVKYQKGPYQLPDPKITMGTNFCDVGFEIDEHANRLILFSAIDNMAKAHQDKAYNA